MLHDIFAYIAIAMFKFTGGVLLIQTMWLWVWLGIWVGLLAWVIHKSVVSPQFRDSDLAQTIKMLIFLPIFFFVMIFVFGPMMAQLNMMRECREVTALVEAPNYTTFEQTMNECRVKEDFYNDFGPWELVAQDGAKK